MRTSAMITKITIAALSAIGALALAELPTDFVNA